MMRALFLVLALGFGVAGCSGTYYNAMEKAGYHKRDILVSRVEKARDSQEDAQEQFANALEQFGSVVKIDDSNLKKAYEKLNAEYEDSEEAAVDVSDRIENVESVSDALFKEWQDELELFQNKSLRATSKKKFKDTQQRYQQMISTMHKAEASMEPVLKTFRDNVLFLKHNLNAQAIGALRGEFNTLKSDIDKLIVKMNTSIESSNQFIAEMGKES
jgi:HD-like signal output (HDOD) protein